MQDENHSNSRNKFIILAVALGLLLLACGVWMRLSRQTAPTQPVAHIPAVKPQPLVATNRIPSAPELATRIAAVQQKLRDIEVARRDLFVKMIAARQNNSATNHFLLAEMHRIQNEMDAAMDNHPLVVARRREMQRILDEQHILDTNSAAILTDLHEKRKSHDGDYMQALAASNKALMEERRKAMEAIGNTNMRKLTAEEAERISAIDQKYGSQQRELVAQFRKSREEPSDVEKSLKREFDDLRSAISAMSDRYKKLYDDMPGFRSLLRSTDPVIAGMDRQLMDLDARRQAVLNATPGVADSDRQIQTLERQRVEVTNELRLLRIQSAAATSNDAPKADGNGKNG